MLPTRTDRRSAIPWIFLGSCLISVLSSLFFYAWFGRADGAVFLQPGRLFSSVLGDGIGALLLLVLLMPLRSAGRGPFWACGIGAVIMLWPPLSEPFSALLALVAGSLAPTQSPWPALASRSLQDWFYCLLHFPDNLVLVTGSALLLAVVARVSPLPPSAGAEGTGEYPAASPGQRGRLSIAAILFSFNGRLNRRPYIVAALAIGIPNTILQCIVPIYVGLPLQILLFWPLLALGTKRAHDRDHGTAWIVCMLGLPGVFGILLEIAVAASGTIGALDLPTLNLVVAVDLLIALPVLWASVEFFFLHGTRGANRYGADLLAAGHKRKIVPVISDVMRPQAAATSPSIPFPPHVTPEAAARFRARFRKR